MCSKLSEPVEERSLRCSRADTFALSGVGTRLGSRSAVQARLSLGYPPPSVVGLFRGSPD
jgi:hypothetical protein